MLTLIIGIIIGFILGVLVARKNKKHVEEAIAQSKLVIAKVEADASARISSLKKELEETQYQLSTKSKKKK